MDKVQRVSKLLVQYMGKNPGPLDMPKAISYVKRGLGDDTSDEAIKRLIRQNSVVEINPVNGGKPTAPKAMNKYLTYGEKIEQAVDSLLYN